MNAGSIRKRNFFTWSSPLHKPSPTTEINHPKIQQLKINQPTNKNSNNQQHIVSNKIRTSGNGTSCMIFTHARAFSFSPCQAG